MAANMSLLDTLNGAAEAVVEYKMMYIISQLRVKREHDASMGLHKGFQASRIDDGSSQVV